MFEAIVVGFIGFTAGYVALMRVMARRADVLHGEFIQPSGSRDAVPPLSIITVIERHLNGFRLLARR